MPIYNHDRFNQFTDFSTLPTMATDIDGLINIANKLWVFIEYKTEGTPINRGQAISYKQLSSQLGKSMPTFCLVAHHDTRASEDITGQNSYVSTVWCSIPLMNGKVKEVDYIGDDRPQLSAFIDGLLWTYKVKTPYWQNGIPDEIYPARFLYENNLHPLGQVYQKAIKNEAMMDLYAQQESIDWDTFPSELQVWLVSIGANGDDFGFYEEVFIPWVTTQYPEEASVAA